MNLVVRTPHLRLCLLALGLLAVTIGATPAVAQGLRSPEPGSVYRDYTLTIDGGQNWRVTDPGATNAGSPGNSPADFLPNPEFTLDIADLAGALRAEAIIDLWGGHVGTTNKRFRLNGNAWVTIPELDNTPSPGQCYTQQVNPVVDVPLDHLQEGANKLTGTAGRQTCYNFRWGQWGWYVFTLRVYFDPVRQHPAGAVIVPGNPNLGENPTIAVEATSDTSTIDRVEVFAYYDGFDHDGDGERRQWHHSYHRARGEDLDAVDPMLVSLVASTAIVGFSPRFRYPARSPRRTG